MKAAPVTIRAILETRQRFCVPIYQRHYVWTRDKQWEPFWSDIKTKAIERLGRRERDRRFSHFIGALVIEPLILDSSKKVTSYYVIDGQQRLITFQLFLAAARHYAEYCELKETAERIELFIINGGEHLMVDAEIEIFKVWPTKHDRELFQDILKFSRKELRKKYNQYFYKNKDSIYSYKTVPNLLGGYGFFYDSIKNTVETGALEPEMNEQQAASSVSIDEDIKLSEKHLGAIWESLIEEFKVVEIRLEDDDDAQIIFETLNERGEPLLAADLVRNNIFQRADSKGEKAEKLFDDHWSPFEDSFWSESEKQGRYRKPRIEFFLANFISGKIGSDITFSKLFSEYKAFIKYLETNSSGGYSSVENEIKDLARYGNIYRKLLEKSALHPLGDFAIKLNAWDVTTVFPLVLRLWAQEDLDENAKKSFLTILLSFIVRRAVCNLTSKNYNKFFLSVIRHLDQKCWSYNKLIQYLISQQSNVSRFPTDKEFYNSWISLPIYDNLQSSKIRFILESLERAKRKKFQETDSITESLSVEHILPNDWREHWPLGNDLEPTDYDFEQARFISQTHFESDDNSTIVERIVRRERLKNTLGNLTLLTQPLNSSVKNKSFVTKRKFIAEHSLLVLNREITNLSEWNEEQIEKRSKALFSLACDIWPYPSPGSPLD